MPHMKNTSLISFITCTCHTCDKCKKCNKCHKCHRCHKCHLYRICHNSHPRFLHQFCYVCLSLCLSTFLPFHCTGLPHTILCATGPSIMEIVLSLASILFSILCCVLIGCHIFTSSIMPWKQLALSLTKNILSFYFGL